MALKSRWVLGPESEVLAEHSVYLNDDVNKKTESPRHQLNNHVMSPQAVNMYLVSTSMTMSTGSPRYQLNNYLTFVSCVNPNTGWDIKLHTPIIHLPSLLTIGVCCQQTRLIQLYQTILCTSDQHLTIMSSSTEECDRGVDSSYSYRWHFHLVRPTTLLNSTFLGRCISPHKRLLLQSVLIRRPPPDWIESQVLYEQGMTNTTPSCK